MVKLEGLIVPRDNSRRILSIQLKCTWFVVPARQIVGTEAVDRSFNGQAAERGKGLEVQVGVGGQ